MGFYAFTPSFPVIGILVSSHLAQMVFSACISQQRTFVSIAIFFQNNRVTLFFCLRGNDAALGYPAQYRSSPSPVLAQTHHSLGSIRLSSEQAQFHYRPIPSPIQTRSQHSLCEVPAQSLLSPGTVEDISRLIPDQKFLPNLSELHFCCQPTQTQ